MQKVKLFDGFQVPNPALGTWTYDDEPDERVNAAVEEALKNNCLHIDTAHVYRDEERVGAVVSSNDIFITTKLFINELTADGVHKGVEQSLKNLKREKLDLVLIHWPAKPDGPSLKETWTALEEEVKNGRVKYIGVSNFNRKRIEEILSFCQIQPAVNQIELHPYLQQKELCQWLKEKKIAVMAYMPFGNRNGLSNNKTAQNTGPLVVEDPVIVECAKKLNKSVYQVIIKWMMQKDYIVVVGSRNPKHVRENLNLDFEVDESSSKKIDSLDKGRRYNDLEDKLGLKDLWV